MQDFQDKVAVVTGAGSGIGRCLAIALDGLGCRVALSDVNEVGLQETATQLNNTHLAERLDVADRAAVYAHAQKVQDTLGPASIVINNAGVGVSDTVENISYDDFEWLMNINFWGVVYGTKAFLPQLKTHSESAMVNISSIFGLFGVPTQSSYNAAKFAVRGFTESLRHEMDAEGSGVTAISVHPGGIRTNIAANARFKVAPDGGSSHADAVANFAKHTRTTAERAAETIITGIRKKSPRVLIGADAKILDGIQRSAPVNYYRIFKRLAPKGVL